MSLQITATSYDVQTSLERSNKLHNKLYKRAYLKNDKVLMSYHQKSILTQQKLKRRMSSAEKKHLFNSIVNKYDQKGMR